MVWLLKQIVMHEKESLGLGIVEFRKPEEAAETWEKLQDQKIEDAEVTITFCIPSKSAVFINNRIMWKFVSYFFTIVLFLIDQPFVNHRPWGFQPVFYLVKKGNSEMQQACNF